MHVVIRIQGHLTTVWHASQSDRPLWNTQQN